MVGFIVRFVVSLLNFLVPFENMTNLISNFFGIVYPAYMSFKVVELQTLEGNIQW